MQTCAACGAGRKADPLSCEWCRGTGRGGYLYYDWIDLLNWKLIELANREITGLIVEAPVRHGKSQLTTRTFPAWYLGTFPDHRAIVTGYNARFASGFGRANRQMILDHGAHFGVHMSGDRTAAAQWELARPHLGGMTTAGVGNPPTGMGGDLIVVDDPIKKAEEAYSEVWREKLWQWWQFDVRSRLEPNGVVCIIMSRWHDDDLVGRLLKRQEVGSYDDDEGPIDKFDVLHLPALASPTPDELQSMADAQARLAWRDQLDRREGDALCPERYNRTQLLRTKREVGPIAFEALWQGAPTAAEGDMFPVSGWNYADGVPYDAQMIVRVDLAGTEKKRSNDPDWTAVVLMGRTEDGRTFVIDADRVRDRDLNVQRFVRNKLIAWEEQFNRRIPIRVEQEPGQSGKEQAANWTRRVLAGFAVTFLPSSGDKVIRAEAYAAQVQGENVWIVKGPWNTAYVEEHRLFPTSGKHDDWVDVSSHAYNDLVRGGGSGRYENTGARRGRR